MTKAMATKNDILRLIDDLPESQYDPLKEYIFFLKHKSYLKSIEKDREEEIDLSRYSAETVYREDRDEAYDRL